MNIDFNWNLIIPVVILQLILMTFALINCYKEETKGPKMMWVFIIVFINIIGPILYFVCGRKSD
ncbi:hypothetical protein BTS2_2344 [Bacillus sp. TS-2]|nr:hypothetical protein BTS2_2344 [Bacillus sp. TS-2]